MVLMAMIASGLLAQESPVLLTIADEQVTLAEFDRIYRKNNNEASLNRQTPEEYLDLFINFKLKVMEAESLGMDTTAKFNNELEGYRKQLAKPYLTDDESKEIMMHEAYDRSQLDINASHILIKLPEFASHEDTLAAYNKITEIRDRIMGGEDFETVAKATSEDQSVNRNGGNLGYFTAFSMIYPFETIAYNTPVGEISMPFRTNYGYHILQIHDQRPARGQIKVAHIYIRSPEEASEEQKKEAYELTQMIYDSLQMGTDFAYMAKTYSDDGRSASNGGETVWFGIGRMFKEFEDACFAIEEKGTYDKPFKSFLGWHIIKLVDKKGIGTYEEMKPDLQEKINRGDRGQHRTNSYISKLKMEHGFSEYPEALEAVYSTVDTSLLTGNWDGGDLIDNTTPLMKIGNRMATTGEFAAFITANQNTVKSRDPISYVDRLYQQFSQDAVMKYEESKLLEKYPEFRYIYQEYHDGILLFDIMDQRVWSKAVTDTIGLAAYHQKHRDNYMWQSRSDAYLITSGKDVNLKGVRKVYKKILKGRVDEAFLNSSLCPDDTIPCITLSHIIVEEGENELVDDMKGQPGLGPVVESGDTKSFVILKKMRPPEPKELNESRGQITSDYQNYLEKEWIKELKQKYPVEVDNGLLSRINI